MRHTLIVYTIATLILTSSEIAIIAIVAISTYNTVAYINLSSYEL